MITKVFCVSLTKKTDPNDVNDIGYKSVYTHAAGFAEAVTKVEAAYPDWKVTGVSFEEDFLFV